MNAFLNAFMIVSSNAQLSAEVGCLTTKMQTPVSEFGNHN